MSEKGLIERQAAETVRPHHTIVRLQAVAAGSDRPYAASVAREAADLIERLTARIEELEWQGWQDIDTAPDDTDVLLGWWRKWPRLEWQAEVGLAHSTKGGWWHGEATHWRPLHPPAALGKEAG